MDSHLRRECWSLLQQLQASQQQLRSKLDADPNTKTYDTGEKSSYRGKSFDDLYNDKTNIDDKGSHGSKSQTQLGKDVSVNVFSHGNSISMPSYARTKLVSATKPEQQALPDSADLKENVADIFRDRKGGSSGINRPALRECNSDFYMSKSFEEYSSDEVDTRNAFTSTENNADFLSSEYASPSIRERRELIDRHTSVPTKLNTEELKDLDDERRLNFNYSAVSFDNTASCARDKTKGHKALSKSKSKEIRFNDNSLKASNSPDQVKKQKRSSKTSKTDVGKTATEKSSDVKQTAQQCFKDQLEDDGNSRKLNNFVIDSTIKAKTKLNSTLYDGSKSLRTTERSSSDQRLLGYDWIAALLDNESGLIKQSESFFDELRDFRKVYKDECCNQFYMEGPHTLVDYEPEPVGEALAPTKVKPYFVNDRLFTEPLQFDLIDRERDGKTQKEPDEQKPRFVRVSIPRSTLQTPYRVKPHRRRSFDSLDSCGLMDHCLLGWENTRPAMIPTARALDLNTEAGTAADWQKTTLAEAERVATTTYDTNLPTTKCLSRLHTLPTWRKCYMDTTLNLSVPSFRHTDLSNTGASGRQGGTKNMTDELMNSTYSMMYEMQRLKQERQLEAMANTKE